jgi:beta-xylosidase
MPDVGRSFAPVSIQTSDEFSDGKLGLQWEWNHNPLDCWKLEGGFLRLTATRATDLLAARNTLTQILFGPQTTITTRLDTTAMRDGQRAGLGMLQVQPNWIGVVQTAGTRRLTWSSAGAQLAGPALDGGVQLRLRIAGESVSYEYSLVDGGTFAALGSPAKLRFSWWKGARPALFSFTTSTGDAGIASFDWVHVVNQATN